MERRGGLVIFLMLPIVAVCVVAAFVLGALFYEWQISKPNGANDLWEHIASIVTLVGILIALGMAIYNEKGAYVRQTRAWRMAKKDEARRRKQEVQNIVYGLAVELVAIVLTCRRIEKALAGIALDHSGQIPTAALDMFTFSRPTMDALGTQIGILPPSAISTIIKNEGRLRAAIAGFAVYKIGKAIDAETLKDAVDSLSKITGQYVQGLMPDVQERRRLFDTLIK